MTEDNIKWALLLEQWKTASQLHRHMDQMAWQGLSYFAAINGALLSVFSVILSSESLSIPLKGILGLCIALFGGSASLVWSKVHKRMQMYHCLRSHQTNTKEQALKELALDQAGATEAGCMLVYDGKRVECHEVVRKRVPCWRWGEASNYTLVFWLAIGLMIVWAIIFIIILAAFICPSRAAPILSTLFVSPCQP